jgi:hypothetical protein
MLLANQRSDEKVVAMRSRPTGAAPTIDADARQLPVLSLLSARHTTDTGHDAQDATLLVSG